MFKDLKIKVKDKLWEFLHQDVRWYIGLGVIVVSLVLCLTLYSVCNGRLVDAFVDVVVSIAFYFLHLIQIKDVINPTVNKFPEIDIQTYVPFSIDEVMCKIDEFPSMFFNGDNFRNYFVFLLESMSDICRFILLVGFPIFILFYIIFDGYTKQDENKEKEAKKHAKRVKSNAKLERVVSWIRIRYMKLVSFLKWFFGFYKKHKWIVKALFVIWLVNTNIMTIIIELFAYYFYFVCSFDIVSLGTQLGKLTYDVIIMLWSLPLLIWVIIGYKIFNYFRFEAAYNELEHFERRNRGFINTLPIVVLFVGPMGVGKTKTLVDMVLSLQNELRDRALALMDKNILRFPDFNWQAFETYLREQIKQRNIKNLATAREHIKNLRYDYGRKPLPQNIWGYDVKKYPHSYNNGLELVGIWKVLENYAQEYFVYSMTVSSIISNIAIRSDVQFIDKGYFESFKTDFFRRDPARIDDESIFSHIIDWDLFRIGCQMNKENRIAGSFEFGVIAVPEIGKERLNSVELDGVKKISTEANQKNDLFNSWLKFIRHNATIENVCFVAFLADEQRAESWGADARELAAVIHIPEISDLKLTLHFCFLPTIFEFVYKYYSEWHDKVKICGNENFYFVSVVRSIMAKIFQRVEYLTNTFGYKVQLLGQEMGTAATKGKSGDNLELHEYFIMNKKTLARRYSTAANQSMFADRTLKAGTSFYDMETYKCEVSSTDELSSQNSYMANMFAAIFIEEQVRKYVYAFQNSVNRKGK